MEHVCESLCDLHVCLWESKRQADRQTDRLSTHLSVLCKQDVYLFGPRSTVIYLRFMFVCLCVRVCVCACTLMLTPTVQQWRWTAFKKIVYKPWEPVFRAGMQGIRLLNPLLLLCDPDGANGGRDLQLNKDQHCQRGWISKVMSEWMYKWMSRSLEINYFYVSAG